MPMNDVLGFRGGFFNRAMRDRRLALGWTQAQLGEAAHVPKQVMGHYETLRSYPPADRRRRIAAVLGLSTDELFPPWLEMMVQERAIRDVPLASLNELVDHAPRALALAASSAVVDPSEIATENAADAGLHEAVRRQLDGLTARERRVVEIRFGFEDGRPRTLQEAAEVFGLHRESIRQIEARALRKMRHPSRSRRLAEYLDSPPLTPKEQEIVDARRAREEDILRREAGPA